jgi:tryptophan synthase alpha chain
VTDRYAVRFAALRERGEGAFVPFVVLGDPDLATSARILRVLVEAGADMLEVGIPFSDPVADGPVIQAATARALRGGVRLADCFGLLREFRSVEPSVPIGLLVYANLVVARSIDGFYGVAAAAGADSVLVADVPVRESAPFVAAARAHGIAPVFIAPPNADAARLDAITRCSEGYTYVVTRRGVTGMDERIREESAGLIQGLRKRGAAPPIHGFGISHPDHVRASLAMGAAGAIAGSAVVSRITRLAADRDALEAELRAFVAAMKAATRGNIQ